jgi:hypothetical protein
MTRAVAAAGLVLLAGCQRSDVKVLVGATAIVAPGAPPIVDSVVVVAGKTVRAVGVHKDVPIPQDSERSNVAGKWVVAAGGGRIAEGEPANLVVLDHAPQGGDAGRRMVEGEWQP